MTVNNMSTVMKKMDIKFDENFIPDPPSISNSANNKTFDSLAMGTLVLPDEEANLNNIKS